MKLNVVVEPTAYYMVHELTILTVSITIPPSIQVLIGVPELQHDCKCCKGVKSDNIQTVDLTCPDGSVISGDIPIIDYCDCMTADCPAT